MKLEIINNVIIIISLFSSILFLTVNTVRVIYKQPINAGNFIGMSGSIAIFFWCMGWII